MMTWLEWLSLEHENVVKEITRGKPTQECFIDNGDITGISLEELEELDNKYIL